MKTNEKELNESLTKFIQQVADMYFMAIRNNEEECLDDPGENYNEYERFVFKVRNAFDRLRNLEKVFINNEFFYQDYPNWWQKDYSLARFKRMKLKSMLKFKEALENEI